MKNILLPLALLLCLSSCYTDKKAQKQVVKALAQKPQLVAKIARDAFPCTTLHLDTTVISMDSVVYVDCPANGSASDYLEAVHDTTRYVIDGTKTIRVPVTLPVKTITITKTIEDSAKIKLASYDLQQEKKSNAELSAKISGRNKLITWLIIFLIGLSIPYIIKLVKLF